MHSAVFATHPRSAGELARLYLEKKTVHLQEVEVMDLDEEAYRSGRVSAQLFGYLRVPYRRPLVQGQKVPTPAGEAATAEAIASEVVEGMQAGWLYVLGPGTTTRAVAQRLGAPKTLTGVDVVSAEGLVAGDVSEEQILHLLEGRPARLVVTPIGGQGFLFGRGNQPISAQVIRQTAGKHPGGRHPGKLTRRRRPLLMDTGDLGLDEIRRYIRLSPAIVRKTFTAGGIALRLAGYHPRSRIWSV
jgi:predicted polyphosphate/ATP-dependent NAD kinase